MESAQRPQGNIAAECCAALLYALENIAYITFNTPGIENGLITLLYLTADGQHQGLYKILLLALSESRKMQQTNPS